ncbi:MAG: putative serine threonine-protein kinase nek2 [Streblomastix strix]|uniref:non-specific serine/threonine protein kinase n=1 Tax=Streblomastix strix TaxID=222440 RepID=A0A5J4WGM4_9EUKA|nr:MAG: putative serine threonine-protein kinase nek2 [Streblomastix strix]
MSSFQPDPNAVQSEEQKKDSNFNNYIQGEKIGGGSYGIVYKIQHKESQQFFVWKKQTCLAKEEEPKLIKEIEFQQKYVHPNIVQFIDAFKHEGSYYIVMEFCGGGSLFSYYKKKRKNNEYISEDEAWRFLYEITDATGYLHSNRVLHRDIKPENVLLSTVGLSVKLIDFGESRQLTKKELFAVSVKGTQMYLCPEIQTQKKFDEKGDIYSIGMTMHEILTQDFPFIGTMFEMEYMKFNGKVAKEIDPSKYSQELIDLIREMRDLDPAKRPSAEQILSHDKVKQQLEKKKKQEPQEKTPQNTPSPPLPPLNPLVQQTVTVISHSPDQPSNIIQNQFQQTKHSVSPVAPNIKQQQDNTQKPYFRAPPPPLSHIIASKKQFSSSSPAPVQTSSQSPVNLQQQPDSFPLQQEPQQNKFHSPPPPIINQQQQYQQYNQNEQVNNQQRHISPVMKHQVSPPPLNIQQKNIPVQIPFEFIQPPLISEQQQQQFYQPQQQSKQQQNSPPIFPVFKHTSTSPSPPIFNLSGGMNTSQEPQVLQPIPTIIPTEDKIRNILQQISRSNIIQPIEVIGHLDQIESPLRNRFPSVCFWKTKDNESISTIRIGPTFLQSPNMSYFARLTARFIGNSKMTQQFIGITRVPDQNAQFNEKLALGTDSDSLRYDGLCGRVYHNNKPIFKNGLFKNNEDFVTVEVYIPSLEATSTPRQVLQQNLNMRYSTIDARPVFRQGGMNWFTPTITFAVNGQTQINSLENIPVPFCFCASRYYSGSAVELVSLAWGQNQTLEVLPDRQTFFW